jgi:16S rRNA (guanine966-N2)-methyltransferase
MSLRIISGKFRGRPIEVPKGVQTRPTTSMLRKAVFDIVQTEIHNTTFLDVFAGSGAMGLEALSCGAALVFFIENHKQAINALTRNIASFHLEKCTTICPLDALIALGKLEKQKKTFDFIYVDPPYKNSLLYQKVLAELNQSALLAKNGSLFIETPIETPLEHKWNNLVLIKERRFGSSLLYQYHRVFC